MGRRLDRLLGALALVIGVGIFTGGFVSARMYYNAGGSPYDVVALRYGVAAAATLPILIFNWHTLSKIPGWWRAAGLALVGGAPFGLCVLTGVAGAPVAHGAGVVPGMALIQGTLLSYLFLREPISRLRACGLLIALAGLLILVLPELRSGEATWWGELSYVGAGILWGSFTVALRAWRITPLQGAMLAAGFSLPYLPVYAIYLEPGIADVQLQQTVAHGIYQGLVFNVVAMMLYGWGVSQLGAVAGVATMPLMPVFGVLMERYILGREPHLVLWLAIALIALGVGLSVAARQAPGSGKS